MANPVINVVDSEGNAAQLHVSSEAVRLHYAGGANQSGISTPSLTLDELTDVDTSGVVNNDSLIYNSGTGNWEPGTPSAASAADPDAQILAWLGL